MIPSVRVYFDNNATTPLDSLVREAMLPWLGELHGNPSSIHDYGRRAHDAVERARDAVGASICAEPHEIVFTSSGTEANNGVLWHVARSHGFEGHIVLSTLEHPSIAKLCGQLEELGMRATRIAPGLDGIVRPESVAAALEADTRLVCVMSASNEIGTLQPVAEIAALCRGRGVWMHCDAVQSLGKVPVDVGSFGADSVTIGAHKLHGPLGAAALWLREGSTYDGGLVGGSQERRRRAGTENVAAIVGFGEACRLATVDPDGRREKLLALRERFEHGLVAAVPDVVIHCRSAPRLPHTSHIAVQGVEGEALLIRLDLRGFAVSTGSACASGVVEPSAALLSMGMVPEEALSSLRISFGMMNTLDEVDAFLPVLAEEAASLRELAPALF